MLTEGGEKLISRFIMTSITRDFAFIILNWKCTCIVYYCQQTNKPSCVYSLWTSIHQACNEFPPSSLTRIQKIRQAVSASISGTGYVLSLCPLKIKSNTMTQLDPINHIKPGGCYSTAEILLFLLPGFFKNASNCMASDRLQILNTSLLSVVFPLLKMNNLDVSLMNNYGLISNPFSSKVIEKAVFQPFLGTKPLCLCLPVRFSTTQQQWDCSC